jgi:hypothetical protein
VKSEAIGPDLGPANTNAAPPAFTQKFSTKQQFPGKVKAVKGTKKSNRGGTPFFGM